MASGTIKVTKIDLNEDGIKELMTSDEMVNVLKRYADEAQKKCGDGYAVSTYQQGKTRSNASVYAATYAAYKDNLENNTLLKAVNK